MKLEVGCQVDTTNRERTGNMSKERQFWKLLITKWNAVSAGIHHYEVIIGNGNLLNSDDSKELQSLYEDRQRLLWSMGVEFPKMYASTIRED